MSRRVSLSPPAAASALVYVVLTFFAILEQVGRTTNDTKTPLVERPGAFLRSATTLWDPTMNFGELQNQAYGYLFPQGPFFLLGDVLQVPPWITERLWSVAIVIVAAEGLRLLARSMGFPPWAAWVAGMAYGLSPRILSQVAVRSAEILPTAVLPWVALPIVLAATGRLAPRRAALLSAVAFLFSGFVNATASVAGLPLVAILIVWAARRRLVPWSMLAWWTGVLTVTNVWWAASLLRLRVYSPPFFDFVEDAKATSSTTGYAATLRGLGNWINYTYLGDQPNWPAGYAYAFGPVLVLASGLLVVVGAVGLVLVRQPWRAPLVVAAALGTILVTIAHTSPFQSPLAPTLQDVLDTGLALLRNVSKAEILLRLPLSLGIGATFSALVAGSMRRRHASERPRSRVLAGVVMALVLGVAQPAVAMQLRNPGWTAVPDYWQQAADYLAKVSADSRAWIVPGTGFGLQSWGWTFDEPFQGIARSPWTSRSQVPLTPPSSIRLLSYLEKYLETGSGSPNLGAALARLGIGHVVVRHDLDPRASDTTTDNLISIALARSRGVERVKLFGQLDLGPAIEVYRVTDAESAPDLSVRALSEVVTVGGASSDVLAAVTEGLIPPGRPAVVSGDAGWSDPADVVGDTYRDRERNFGRVHDAEGPVRARGEPRLGGRVVPDYPANEASKPVRASYEGGASASASSSLASTAGLGLVEPQSSPYAAFDGDASTGWRSEYYAEPRRQWVQVRWPTAREIGRVQVRTPVSGEGPGVDVSRFRVSAGGTSVRAVVDPFTGLATADLSGVRGRSLRVSVDQVRSGGAGSVSVLEVRSAATPYDRTLLVPPGDLGANPSFVFTAQPETRACIATLLGPDCSPSRKRPSEESTGIDRTFTVDRSGTWSLGGTAVSRSTLGTVSLLNPVDTPVVLRSSSQWLTDPAVSVRLAYDGATTTSWIADPRDDRPRITVDFDRPRRIDRLGVSAPSSPAVAPLSAVIRTQEGQVRRVEIGAFGQFEPIRTRRLTITFANSTRGGAPIGISELYLPPAKVAAPLDGGVVTGAVCGLGPRVEVDGRSYQTQVRGFIGDVASAGPMRYDVCSGPIRLAPGKHRLRVSSTEQFQPVTGLLTTRERRTTVAERTLSDPTGPITRQVMRVGPGAASMLSTTRNRNPGWRATLNGRALRPMVSDGWAQAWRVPQGAGGRVVISYAPQRPYLITLYAGLAVAAAFLLAAIVLLARTRLRTPRSIPGVDRPRPGPARWWAGLVLAVPATWLLGGLPAAIGALAGGCCVLAGRRTLARVLAVVALASAYSIQAWLLRDGLRVRFDAVDLLAGIGFALVLASLVPRPRRAPHSP